MIFLRYAVSAIVAYLIGNVSTGILISKAVSHRDIRNYGSGSAGATNMLRTLGWVPSLLTLAGDTLKAVIAALIGRWLAGEIGMLIAGVCVIIGHNWPVFLGFKGGKGISASLGFALVACPPIAVAVFLLEIALIAVTRYVSVASMTASVLYAVLTAIFFPGNWPRIIAACIVAALALFSHRANIERLIHGTENRLDFGKIRELSRKKGEDNK